MALTCSFARLAACFHAEMAWQTNCIMMCLLQGGGGAPALQKALRPTTHRLSAADARLLEESLRFGVTRLFCADLDTVQRSDADGVMTFASGQPSISCAKAAQDAKPEERMRSGVLERVEAKLEESENRHCDAMEPNQAQGDSEMNDENGAPKDGVQCICSVGMRSFCCFFNARWLVLQLCVESVTT